MVAVKGGDRLSAELTKMADALGKGKTVRVGFMAGRTYPNGTSVAMVAAIQEFGAPRAGIPPRPFFRTMIANKKGEWPAAIGQTLVDNHYDTERTLAIVGDVIADQLADSIIALIAPPLSKVTVMLRKMFGNSPERIRRRDVNEARRRVDAGESVSGISTKPLVWTGYLLKSIDSEVRT